MALLQANKNSDLGSANFDKKKITYEKSPYSLTSQIATELKWTKQGIANRQKILANYALLAWKL